MPLTQFHRGHLVTSPQVGKSSFKRLDVMEMERKVHVSSISRHSRKARRYSDQNDQVHMKQNTMIAKFHLKNMENNILRRQQ